MTGPTISINLFSRPSGSFDQTKARRYAVAWKTVGKMERGWGYHTHSNAKVAENNNDEGFRVRRFWFDRLVFEAKFE